MTSKMPAIGQRSFDLSKKPRIGESIIQFLLFASGILSIFTTIGIAVVLGREAVAFFTNTLWEDVNKTIPIEVPADVDTFTVTVSGANRFEEGGLIRIQQEQMEVVSYNEETGEIVVIRGAADTEAEVHSAGAQVFVGTKASLVEFFTSTRWFPQLGDFGIWPLLTSTLMVATIAMIVALPLGLSVAIYLSEYADSRVRTLLKPILEVLAGIPTVVYGYFALTFMTPVLRSVFGVETVDIYNTASAGIVIGVLILPLVSSMSEDALSAVPNSLRQASYGLGATKFETATRVVVPAALSGITAAFIVAISRAIGETMIVAIAAGAGPNFTLNPFVAAETMTGHIVRISGGDISYDSIDYRSIFAIGLLLFIMTLTLNVISRRIVARFREVYE